jgi:hypothetical protein
VEVLLPIMIVVAALSAPPARAQTADAPTLWMPKSKLDLPVVVPLMKQGTQPDQLYYSGFGVKFGGPASGWEIFGGAVEGSFFTLAVINAFMPRWLPKGMARRMNLNGTGGRSPSDVGVDDYGMGYSEH